MNKKGILPFWLLFLVIVLVMAIGFWVDTQMTGSTSNHIIIEIMTVILVGIISLNWSKVNN